ncbi:hypothetical protein [Sphingomonas sp.]|uniref:hypothetical protein n=1 Tax=Sphingomonas sp. TaxID=28214 RepID=UPI003CC52512
MSAALLATAAVVPLPTLAIAHAAPAPSLTCNDGKDRRVRMINASGQTIQNLYGSNVNRRSWEEDVLGDQVLRPGAAITINWDDGSCACAFDFKAVYSGGDSNERRGIDVCRITEYTFGE